MPNSHAPAARSGRRAAGSPAARPTRGRRAPGDEGGISSPQPGFVSVLTRTAELTACCLVSGLIGLVAIGLLVGLAALIYSM